MRLAVIRQRADPYPADQRHYEDALEALLERNVAISAYSRGPLQTRLQLIEPQPIDPRGFGALWRDWSFARKTCQAIARAKVDLVQSHELLLCCDVYCADDGVHSARLEQRLLGAGPLSRLLARASPYNRYRLAMERRLFASRWLRAVICGSRKIADEIQTHYGVAASKLHVIAHPVEVETFHPDLAAHRDAIRAQYGIAADAVVFLFVGTEFEWNGVPTALAALAELPAHAHLIVVGHDSRQRNQQRLARALGVDARVAFAGLPTDARPYFGAADAFVWPTRYDVCPREAYAAMACALPIITTPQSSAAELALAHEAGLVCPPGDAPALAAQMRALLDESTRKRLGARARDAVLARTRAAMTLQLVLLYRDLFDQAPKRPKAHAAPAPPDPASNTDRATTRPAGDASPSGPDPSA